jgi:small subunit ribosomal protein S16
MLKIRFLRLGKKHQPLFRMVVTDKKNPPQGGRFIELLGFYNPLTKEKKINKERIGYWMGVGAEPSDTVFNFLVKEGVITGKKRNVVKISKKRLAKINEKKAASVPQGETGASASPLSPQGPSETSQEAVSAPAGASASQAEPTEPQAESVEPKE